MSRRLLISLLSTLALLSVSAFAQDKPNFTGTWKLNVAKSDFGPVPGPDSQTNVIDHKEPNLTINVTQEGQQGKQNYTIKLTTDGKEIINQAGGHDVKNSASWEGPALIVNTKLNFNDNDVIIKSSYTLSDDAKTMSVAAHINSPMGELDQKYVFDKQDAAAATATGN